MREQSLESSPEDFDRAARPDAGVSVTTIAGTVCLSALFLAILYVATLLNLAPAKQTLGWASAYTLISVAPPLVLSLLEHVTRPAGPRKSAKKWVIHFQIMLANYASGIPFALLATYLASLLVKSVGLDLGLVDFRVGDGKSLASIAAALVLASFVSDFFFYWYHRSLHASTILWQHHKMHHLDPEFDALTGPRQNWLENFFLAFFTSIPVAVLFKLNDAADPLGAGLVQGAIVGFWTLVNFQNHSNLRLQFGRATVFLTSSQESQNSSQLSSAASRQEFRRFLSDMGHSLWHLLPSRQGRIPVDWRKRMRKTSAPSGKCRFSLCGNGGKCIAPIGKDAP